MQLGLMILGMILMIAGGSFSVSDVILKSTADN